MSPIPLPIVVSFDVVHRDYRLNAAELLMAFANSQVRHGPHFQEALKLVGQWVDFRFRCPWTRVNTGLLLDALFTPHAAPFRLPLPDHTIERDSRSIVTLRFPEIGVFAISAKQSERRMDLTFVADDAPAALAVLGLVIAQKAAADPTGAAARPYIVQAHRLLDSGSKSEFASIDSNDRSTFVVWLNTLDQNANYFFADVMSAALGTPRLAFDGGPSSELRKMVELFALLPNPEKAASDERSVRAVTSCLVQEVHSRSEQEQCLMRELAITVADDIARILLAVDDKMELSVLTSDLSPWAELGFSNLPRQPALRTLGTMTAHQARNPLPRPDPTYALNIAHAIVKREEVGA